LMALTITSGIGGRGCVATEPDGSTFSSRSPHPWYDGDILLLLQLTLL
jgi:hypothetical protein